MKVSKATSLLSGINLDLLEVSGKLDEYQIQIDSWPSSPTKGGWEGIFQTTLLEGTLKSHDPKRQRKESTEVRRDRQTCSRLKAQESRESRVGNGSRENLQ